MTAERVWAKIDVRGPDECWPWQGERHRQGYGRVKVDGRRKLAHRVVSELVGGPIPAGLKVRHSCDNPPCCNPAHLLRGTQAANVRDREARGRTARGEAVGTARLTAAAVRRIRATEGMSQRRLAACFGVSRGAVRAIREGRTWRHLGG